MLRKTALTLVYLGSWIAGMELAAELILAYFLGPLPKFALMAARAAQVVGILVAAGGLVRLLRRDAVQRDSADEIEAVLQADRVLRAYTQDVMQHLFYVGVVLSLLAAYSWAFYLRILSAEPDHLYYLALLVLGLVGLVAAWLVPYLRFRREEKNLERVAREAP